MRKANRMNNYKDKRYSMKKHIVTVIVALMSIPFITFGALVDTDGNPATNETSLAVIDMARSVVKDIKDVALEAVTNTVVVGYTEWKFSGNIEESVSYSITAAAGEGSVIYTLWNSTTASQLATYTTNTINATYLPFDVSGGTIYARCSEIRRNANGLAMYSDVKALETKIDDMDTSYLRTAGITNKN